MEANELRIGNYYRQLVLGDVVRVDLFTFSEWYSSIRCGDDSTGDYMMPIPITEEWLVKLGFDYIKNHKEYHNRGINEGAYHLKRVGDAFNRWYLYHKEKMITSNIRFIHQLQNLYFALTGIELEIKN